MEQKQGFLGRVVDIGAELFAMAATCVRAESQRAADSRRGEQAYELAEAFCQQATLRVEALFEALWTNTDGTDAELARNVVRGATPGWKRGSSTSPRAPGRGSRIGKQVSRPNPTCRGAS